MKRIKRTIGGQRLGSGRKMQVNLQGFGRASFNLNQVFKTDQAAGPIVPCFCDLATNGTDYYIKLDAKIRTLPTNGPIFGIFKHQVDVFQIPLRLYIAALHNNELNAGMRMDQMKFPITQYTVQAVPEGTENPNLEQVSPDSLTAYLGIMGLGTKDPAAGTNRVVRTFPAFFELAYWDIIKNYYANKQEEIGYVIGHREGTVEKRIFEFLSTVNTQSNPVTNAVLTTKVENGKINSYGKGSTQTAESYAIAINFKASTSKYDIEEYIKTVKINRYSGDLIAKTYDLSEAKEVQVSEINTPSKQEEPLNYAINTGSTGNISILISRTEDGAFGFPNGKLIVQGDDIVVIPGSGDEVSIEKFELKNIDDMRKAILRAPEEVPFNITTLNSMPYAATYGAATTNNVQDPQGNNCYFSQAGLALKTYQSDRFNNWLQTEWIDGENGINEITAVQVVDGKITMNALLLQEKMFNMYNRTAISGGSFDDWQEVQYGERTVRKAESPIYEGGISSEIYFDEVVSTADAGEDNPLGSLAGRGSNDSSKRGSGKMIHVHVMEPSIIMIVESITPRVTYSQGNEWWTQLKTMDDLHVPSLDGLGFQDLITEEMAAFDTIVHEDGSLTKFSAGKQLSWTHYMTKVDKAFGSFAAGKELEFMTLNREYEATADGRIKDLTTYVDPVKFNKAFADAQLSAKNFWVQIGIECTVRRKMSANQMPIM